MRSDYRWLHVHSLASCDSWSQCYGCFPWLGCTNIPSNGTYGPVFRFLSTGKLRCSQALGSCRLRCHRPLVHVGGPTVVRPSMVGLHGFYFASNAADLPFLGCFSARLECSLPVWRSLRSVDPGVFKPPLQLLGVAGNSSSSSDPDSFWSHPASQAVVPGTFGSHS